MGTGVSGSELFKGLSYSMRMDGTLSGEHILLFNLDYRSNN